MTQLPPERTAALALTLPSGGALPGFHVQARVQLNTLWKDM